MTTGRTPLAVIIGAGRTGRGFVARLVHASSFKIVFIDQSESLVQQLNVDQKYSVHYFGKVKASYCVDNFVAYAAGTEGAIEAMAAADIIFTAVGEHHIHTLDGPVRLALALRRHRKISEPMKMITCENGIAPGEVLLQSLSQSSERSQYNIVVSEAAIFCTTVALEFSRLDVLSEAYDQLPYDSQQLSEDIRITGLVPTNQFRSLIQRKIYTYNCISACIAYLGAYKGYSIYSDAANDVDIQRLLDQLCIPLSAAICSTLQLDREDQRLFFLRAIDKFSNRDIIDYVDRNAMYVVRKLGPTERLIAPIRLIEKHGGDVSILALVVAAAMNYSEFQEMIAGSPLSDHVAVEKLCEISGLTMQDPVVEQIHCYYTQLHQGEELAALLNK